MRNFFPRRSKWLLVLLLVVVFGCGTRNIVAQTASTKELFVPLIGITSVPDPLALPKGSGTVTYHYAVKSFVQEAPLTDVRVIDDHCSAVQFIEGDDNGNAQLDYNETWRYTCTTKVSTTTQSTATATGIAHNITATHSAYAMVVVGSEHPAPLVSIVNITKVAYPLSLPIGGGKITFTYKVNNPGIVPLSDVTVSDDKCSAMSGKLGDTNYNDLLDPNEVWIYTCTMNLAQTTTNTATVTAFANGLRAVDKYSLTVKVEIPPAEPVPSFPETGTNSDFKIMAWEILSGILVTLTIFFIVTRPRESVGKP